jgi:hypothetical protein
MPCLQSSEVPHLLELSPCREAIMNEGRELKHILMHKFSQTPIHRVELTGQLRDTVVAEKRSMPVTYEVVCITFKHHTKPFDMQWY